MTPFKIAVLSMVPVITRHDLLISGNSKMVLNTLLFTPAIHKMGCNMSYRDDRHTNRQQTENWVPYLLGKLHKWVSKLAQCIMRILMNDGIKYLTNELPI